MPGLSRRRALGVLASLGLCLGCSRASPNERTLNVFAASSLNEAFRECGLAFEALHPGTVATLNFAGSQTLRLQIEQGARADIFASADPQQMAALIQSKKIKSSAVLAHNELVVIVPHQNPARLQVFEDLSRARRIVIGQASVPIGGYTEQLLKSAGKRYGADFEQTVRRHVVSKESNVRLVRAKVELGEADAAIVYRTDATASGRVKSIAIPRELNIRADYPMAIVGGSQEPALAQAWVAFMTSAPGQDILRKHGFLVGP